MKRKLKTYQDFRNEHIKENFMKRDDFINKDKTSDENLEDIKENDEEVIDSDKNIEDSEAENQEVDVIVDEPSKKEVTVEIEATFNPSICTPTDFGAPKIFSVVRMMTQNGEKIGMCYTENVGEYGSPLHNNIDFNSACNIVKTCCQEMCLDEFNVENDKIIGIIPTFMIPKNKKETTSYIPK